MPLHADGPFVPMDLSFGQLLPRASVGILPPWLVLVPPLGRLIRIDLRFLDCVYPWRDRVVLACGDVDVELDIEEGSAAAARVCELALDYMRVSAAAAATPRRAGLMVFSPKNDVLQGSVVELPNVETKLYIGREAGNHIVLNHPSVSRVHAVLVVSSGQATVNVIDQGSANGVIVNGARCIGHQLRDGDLVALGAARLFFLTANDGKSGPGPAEAVVMMGSAAVSLHGDRLAVGPDSFSFEEVRVRAERGEYLVTDRCMLPAAIARLAMAQPERDLVHLSDT